LKNFGKGGHYAEFHYGEKKGGGHKWTNLKKKRSGGAYMAPEVLRGGSQKKNSGVTVCRVRSLGNHRGG